MTITWEQILAFLCEDQSMAVTSLLFIAFFVAVALVHYLLPRVLRPYFLLAASPSQNPPKPLSLFPDLPH